MATEVVATAQQDLEALCQSLVSGQPKDPALLRRIQERSAIVQKELKQRGLPDLAVNLVREIREE